MQAPVVVNINQFKPPYVEPFNIRVQPGDTITLRTETKTSAAVVIPGVKLFTDLQQKDNYHQFVIDEGSEQTLKISETGTSGYYTFHVFIIQTGKFADNPGYSAPKIIIQ
jgi:plastocyanin